MAAYHTFDLCGKVALVIGGTGDTFVIDGGYAIF